MKINYNVTGPKRKSLIGAISQELNAPTKYLGAPTFAYEVGGYHIDKNGMLEGEDNHGLVADLQGLHDFKAITEEFDTQLPQAEPTPEDIQIPYEVALGGRVSPYNDYEEPLAYAEPEQSDEVQTNRLTIELPKYGFTDVALENLQRLVESKSTLIKKSLGTDCTSIIKGEETIAFPWFQGELTTDEIKAYTHLVTALGEMAKVQQRVNATEKQVDNEKYAFRCFLVRLGFVGSEHKEDRKILLKNLSGNSAFKSGTPTKLEEVMADE